MDNKKKVIIVTGASSGIGECTAKHLISCGYTVVATARREDKLLSLFGDNNEAVIIPWDLSELDSIDEYSKKVADKCGEINGLVHCAGISHVSPLYLTKSSDIQKIFNINTFAAMRLVGAFSKKNKTSKPASFVLISSMSAHEGVVGSTAYASSKAAIEGFVQAAVPELADREIRINCIAPGVVETEMTAEFQRQLSDEKRDEILSEYPFGLGKPEDVANLIEYLIDEKSRWITGRTFVMDGGHLSRK